MKDLKHEAITKGIGRLTVLTGEDFHGYRSEIYNVLSAVYEASSKKPLNKSFEYSQTNDEECTCPQGSLCDFFDENEQCQYGKI